MEILIALLLLGIIILLHELGHFLTAKYFKMPVLEFAIGMGPEIYSYFGGKTSYSIRAIPMGGYVNIDGMDVDSKVENGFNSKPPLERFVVLFSGVFMNFVSAFLMIVVLTFMSGNIIQNESPKVFDFTEVSRATKVLKKGDIFKEIQGEKIEKWNDIGKAINKEFVKNSNGTNEIQSIIERDGKEIQVSIPTLVSGDNRRVIGIIPEIIEKKYTLSEGINQSFKTYTTMFKDVLNGLKTLVTGRVKAHEISGPVGIIKVVGEASKGGEIEVLIFLFSILSINVGIFNLLPVPALDGGRIIFTALELIGIKINKKIEEKFHMVGMFLLIALVIFATFNDVINIFK